MAKKLINSWIVLVLVSALFSTYGTKRAAAGNSGLSTSQINTPALQTQRVPTFATPTHFNSPQMLSSVIAPPTTVPDLAYAMGIKPADLISAGLNGSDVRGAAVGSSPLGASFPTEGGTFVILSSGLAESADDPNASGSLSFVLDGLNNSQGRDLTQLALRLRVPANMNCVSFDFAYYSEEFPEFVGSIFNDAFTAELGGSNFTIVNNQVVAPLNFAFDTQGHIISVNTVFGVTLNSGTTYDGATNLLRAHAPVSPNSVVDIVLSVQDLGDSIYDSAVFLDKFFWSNDSQCNPSAEQDSDGDGLLDTWETEGLTVPVDGTDVFVDLPAMGADPNKKDVFVEIDYMVDQGTCVPEQGCTGGHSHKPKAEAMAKVVEAFMNAPVSNPDGSTGINLHVDYGADSEMNPVTHETWGSLSQSNSLEHDDELDLLFAWNKVKKGNFSKARAAVFHYCMFIHDMQWLGGTSGISRWSPASDFIVSLGSWTDEVGTVNEQAGTFMHELGHNLGLRHGGGDDDKFKPNYLSVMNYSFQTSGLRLGLQDGHLDYSRFLLPVLDEDSLDESIGLNGGAEIDNYGTRYYCDGAEKIVDHANDPIDWNCDNDTDDTGVTENLNNDTNLIGLAAYTELESYDDWANLVFTGGAIGQPGAEPELETETEADELTEEENALIASPYKVALSDLGDAVILPGETVNQVITVTNLGANADTYTINTTSSEGWADVSSVPATLSLAVGASQEFLIPVTVPVSANVSQKDILTFTAVSQGNSLMQDVAIAETSVVGAKVLNIQRVNDNPTSKVNVGFTVTFFVPVTGVDSTDFALTTTGVKNASITDVTGSGDTYNVTVSTGSGSGTIRLDIADDDSIMDGASEPLGTVGAGNGDFTSGETYHVEKPVLSLLSANTYDGWILESTETSNAGGKLSKNATTLLLGDDASNRQYRSILSFDTTLPEGAIITSITLEFKYAGKSGTLPFSTHGKLLVDVCKGAFKGSSTLQLSDFNSKCALYKSAALVVPNIKVDNWYSQSFDLFDYINPAGVTQFRLRFAKDDNNDFGADLLKIYSGNADPLNRPRLIIEYALP